MLLEKSLISALSKPIQKKCESAFAFNPKSYDEKKIQAIKQQLLISNNKYDNSTSEEELARRRRIPFKTYHRINWEWASDSEESTLFSSDKQSVCMHTNSSSYFETIAIRSSKPLRVDAFTYWEVKLSKGVCSGTSVMLGVGTLNAKLRQFGYSDLIGQDKSSWGLSVKGHLMHENLTRNYCDSLCEEQNNNVIGCLFDGYRGRLGFFVNGVYQGVAFDHMPLNKCNSNELDLYPIISSTVAESIFTLELVYESFPSLQELCSNLIRKERGDMSESIYKCFF